MQNCPGEFWHESTGELRALSVLCVQHCRDSDGFWTTPFLGLNSVLRLVSWALKVFSRLMYLFNHPSLRIHLSQSMLFRETDVENIIFSDWFKWTEGGTVATRFHLKPSCCIYLFRFFISRQPHSLAPPVYWSQLSYRWDWPISIHEVNLGLVYTRLSTSQFSGRLSVLLGSSKGLSS